MSDTMQSLDQLSSLKTATAEGPKYVKKVDKLGRAYAPASARTRLLASGSSRAPARSLSTRVKSKFTSLARCCA